MKRFWLEELWRWSRTARMTTGRMFSFSLYTTFTILVLIQLVPSTSAVGQECDLKALTPCSTHKMCVEVRRDTGVCKCQPQFILDETTGNCEEKDPPEEPSSSHLGLGLGLGLMFFLLLVVVALTLAHHKFGLFSGMCDNLPPLRLFGRRGQDISMVNNEDDDVNPIV